MKIGQESSNLHASPMDPEELVSNSNSGWLPLHCVLTTAKRGPKAWQDGPQDGRTQEHGVCI
jgi:hypothetical protein